MKLKRSILVLFLLVVVAMPSEQAFATTVAELSYNYQVAVENLEEAIDDQAENADEIEAVEGEIVQTQEELDRTHEQVSDTMVALYKEGKQTDSLIQFILESDSFQEAARRYDLYQRVERHQATRARNLMLQQSQLNEHRAELEQRKAELSERVTQAQIAVDEAEQAYLRAMHSDGADYHQTQGNGSNCGATSFIVGVNMLMHEEITTDNVAVWKGAGFKGDSTNNLAYRGLAWLFANGLSDEIGIEEVVGDIHTTEGLRELLDEGNVVVISSGSGSLWQRADGTELVNGFPDGHWIVFYQYEDGNFYANDSSVGPAQGAGVAYSESQMQQWLDGRGNHFATVMYRK